MTKNKNFLYGIGKVKFNGFEIGYIEKNSWNNNGKKPEVVEINAEQKPSVPVLIIPQTNGTIAPTFNLIQLNYVNLAAALGGEVVYEKTDTEKKTPIGWEPEDDIILLSGGWCIDLVSGQSILIANGTLLAALGGQLTLTETAKVECEIRPSEPEDGGKPYAIYDTDAIGEIWKTRCGLSTEPAAEQSQNEG